MAATAVMASSSGMPAATSAPNAMTRITRVIGSEVTSAFLKSSSKALEIALSALASPNCSTRSSGWRLSTAATASSTGSTRSSVWSSSPAISNPMSAERPSCEIAPSVR